MKLITLNQSNEVVNENTNDKFILTTLLQMLWIKHFQVTNDIKQIRYKYNYTDEQTIKVLFSNGMKYIFEGIPTRHCVIDIDKLMKGGE